MDADLHPPAYNNGDSKSVEPNALGADQEKYESLGKEKEETMIERERPCQLAQYQGAKEKLSDYATVVFVLGGPGSGKGTQCPLIVRQFGFIHLSAGDLLQAEIQSGSENGKMIQEYKKEGKIVPSEVTVKLLQQAMQRSRNKKFLIDGFPRDEENRAAFENVMKLEPDFVLFFDCPEEELTRRILNRNQGRVDDNIQTIPKRLRVYFESTLPVIEYYSFKGKVQKIDAERPVQEVFEEVKSVFFKFNGGYKEGY